MHRFSVLWSASRNFRFQHPWKGRWVSTVTPRKPTENDATEGHLSKTEPNPDPIVTFSRPPPVPPVLGPLVALSLLDSWLMRDNDE